MHHGSNKGLNINSNSGNGSNVVTSANASGNHQLLGMQHFNDLRDCCIAILFQLNWHKELNGK